MIRNTIASVFRALIAPFRINQRIETGRAQTINQTWNAKNYVTTEIIGSTHFQRPLGYTPVRDASRAYELVRLCEIPEVAAIIEIMSGDVFSSSDGDDLGFSIAEDLEDGTLVDPQMREVGNNVIKRCLSTDVLHPVVVEYLSYGDCFRSILVDDKLTKVIGLKHLPCWELFRIEDDDQLKHFEQRRWQSQEQDALIIDPAICVHWRYRRRRLYGRSLFEESSQTASSLDRSYISLDKAGVSVGTNANVHQMPEGWGAEETNAYRLNYEEKLKTGVTMTDFYTFGGGDVKKLASQWPDLKALQENVMHFRRRIAMSGMIPPWMLGIEQPGAKDIAGGPLLAYVRRIGAIRQTLSYGLKQIIDLELILNGYYEPEQRQYRIIFPKLWTNPQSQSVQAEGEEEEENESNSPGIADLDATIEGFRSLLKNGAIATNGHRSS